MRWWSELRLAGSRRGPKSRNSARELPRRQISQTAVRTFFVVFLSPCSDLGPRFKQIPKPARVQAFVSQLSVKTFYMSVLHRPPRLDVHQLDLPLQAPRQEVPAGQLRTVVTTDRPRHSAPRHDRLQHPRYSPAGKTRVYLQRQTLSRVHVDHAQRPELPPAPVWSQPERLVKFCGL